MAYDQSLTRLISERSNSEGAADIDAEYCSRRPPIMKDSTPRGTHDNRRWKPRVHHWTSYRRFKSPMNEIHLFV